VVLGYYFTSDRDGRTSGRAACASDACRRRLATALDLSSPQWNGYGANLAPFWRQAAPTRRLLQRHHRVATAWCVPLPLIGRASAGSYYESL
jgi:adenylate cyclase